MLRRKNQRGTAVIEFAVSFTALWFVFMGTFQFGYTLWLYNGVMTQVADAARYAMRATYDDRNSTYLNAVRNMVVYGNTSGTGTAVVPGIRTQDVEVLFNPAAGQPDTVTIRMSAFSVNAIFRTFNFANRPSVTVKYAGQYQTDPTP